jgi:hypothetical protein
LAPPKLSGRRWDARVQEHKKKCEKDGKYKEARTAAKRLADLKMHEEQKHKRDMLARHAQEQADAQRAFAMEQEQHRMMWDLKVCPVR